MPHRNIASSLALLALFCAPALACGSASTVVRPTSEFTAEDAQIFQDAVDFVGDPDVLEGRWREEWSNDLQSRVEAADVVAVVRVGTLRTDIDPGQVRTFRLIANARRVLLGEVPDRQLTLMVAQGQGGFETVDGNEARILDNHFVAFVKWYETPTGDVAGHWHLSPATEGVVRRVEYLAQRREPITEGRTRTVVH